MKHSLLLIDDDRPRTDALATLARGTNMDVTVCEKGKDGLKRADTLLPSAIVLSAELGTGAGGWSVCNSLKRNPVLSKIPLLFLVDGDEPQQMTEQHKRLKTRAEKYMTLPASPDEILAQLEGMLPLDRRDHLHQLYQIRERTPSPSGYGWLLGLIILVAIAGAVLWFLR